ncbi:uncharacterized protein BJ171DRAFT_516093 [Polychytrium aggregatum]|uniref:uncharacterized protein n=1 Tax=Polychytrium aggregatum TaxID=110093 RepID=UPI0022FE1B68|nr:uncharacterized protein BJ171DRAFT_516093 [Polychytrium aggregatum]KAI9201976.1 hypothetical protein BJ171DRAFT_516093 [Polychytrium aggregatum]
MTQLESVPEGFVAITEDGGLFKKVNKPGSGPVAANLCKVAVHYTGYLFPSGEKFDSSLDRGQPLEFSVGEGRVISGWDKGIATMQLGESAELLCTPAYAYGEEGSPPTIPPNATLRFEVEMLRIDPPSKMSVAERLIHAKECKDSGNAFYKSQDWKEAIAAYEHGLRYLDTTWTLKPEETVEFNALKLALCSNSAACFLKTKDLFLAVDKCRQALEIDEKNAKAMFRLAQAYCGLAEFDNALKFLNSASEIDPNDAAIKAEIAVVKRKRQEFTNKEKSIYSNMFK